MTSIIPIEDYKHLETSNWERIMTLLDAGARWFKECAWSRLEYKELDRIVFSNGPQDTLTVEIHRHDWITIPYEVEQSIRSLVARKIGVKWPGLIR